MRTKNEKNTVTYTVKQYKSLSVPEIKSDEDLLKALNEIKKPGRNINYIPGIPENTEELKEDILLMEVKQEKLNPIMFDYFSSTQSFYLNFGKWHDAFMRHIGLYYTPGGIDAAYASYCMYLIFNMSHYVDNRLKGFNVPRKFSEDEEFRDYLIRFNKVKDLTCDFVNRAMADRSHSGIQVYLTLFRKYLAVYVDLYKETFTKWNKLFNELKTQKRRMDNARRSKEHYHRKKEGKTSSSSKQSQETDNEQETIS